MGIQGLNWTTLQIPLVAGLNQKADDRAAPMPSLRIAKDLVFDESGGVQTRKPFAAMPTAINGGGSLTEVRRVVANGDELLTFTRTGLYSWSATKSAWINKGEYLAAKVDEDTRFASMGDQIDADRAELAGIALYTWSDAGALYLAAIDMTTGAVTLPPTVFSGGSRARLVALDTKVQLFFYDNVNPLSACALDPLNPVVTGVVSVMGAATFNLFYDVVAIPGANASALVARRTTTTSYSFIQISAAMVVTATVRARNCDGPIALAVSPDAQRIQVIRTDATNVVGDLLFLSGGAYPDLIVNQALGTVTSFAGAAPSGIGHVTAAFVPTPLSAGVYRCWAFWSAGEVAQWPGAISGDPLRTQKNSVDTNGAIGAISSGNTLAHQLAVASRAFPYDGHVYVWLTFAGESDATNGNSASFRAQLQNAYFLYREDGFIAAKATSETGGGFATVGYLPNVQLGIGSTTKFSFLGGVRRVIEVGTSGKQTNYASRSPREVAVAFDSNEARRCARLGRTLYIAGGELLQYDGQGLAEVGFHVYPWYFTLSYATGGAIENGSYAYKLTWRWANARGDSERSTTATVAQTSPITGVSGVRSVAVDAIMPLIPTKKAARRPPAIEVWRTAKNPGEDAPFYLVSSKDPAVRTGANRYIPNHDPGQTPICPVALFTDTLIDATITTNESNPETGLVLESLAPPACSIVLAGADRLFLAGISGDTSRVWYSRLRGDGEVASFHDALTATIPTSAGPITALGLLNETLVAFTATAVYALPGDGADNTGGGATYGPARLLSSDVGALVHESVALTAEGLVFKSAKGWYRLGRGYDVQYIGAKVSDYDAEPVLAVHVLEGQHHLRVVTPSRVLLMDTDIGEWAEWTIASALGACIWRGVYTYLGAAGPMLEQSTYTGLTYGLDVELQVKLSDLQGFGRVRRILLIGEFRSSCKVRIRLSRDYQYGTYFDDVLWPATPEVVGGPLQMQHGPSQQQCESMTIRITACAPESVIGNVLPPTGEALKLSGLAFEAGVRPTGYRRLPAAQRK